MVLSQRIRRWALVLLTLSIMGLFVARLMHIQIIEAEKYQKMLEGQYFSSQVIKATRGEILDRNGKPLAVNRMGYDVIFDKAFLPPEQQNDIILGLVELFENMDEDWSDTLPITQEQPYRYKADSEAQAKRLNDFLGVATYGGEADAQNAMYWLVDRYALEEYGPREQRIIAGIRYDMEQRGFAVNVPYTIATDVDMSTVVAIKERSHKLIGVDIGETAVRSFPDGTVAPHIIGTIGPIYDMDEYNALKEKGYYMDDTLGKSGVEMAFEDFLRGINGRREIRINARGDVLSAVETEPPIPGSTLMLTLDNDLQFASREALEKQILFLQETSAEGKGKEANAGAVVVLNPQTGEILASVTYPSYDLNTYRQQYSELVADTANTPLVDRALNGTYTPGSTFKPAVAVAGLTTGTVGEKETVNCTRVYDFYRPSYMPTCMGYHGNIDTVGALTVSCNIFFYDVGRRMGIDEMCRIVSQFGLGQKTGIEIPEKIGTLSSPEAKEADPWNDNPWYPGDVLQSAIGQLYNEFTPLQLANYAATLANRGNRMKLTIVREIRDYSLESVEVPFEPIIAERVDASQEDFELVIAGMVAASRTGTAAENFSTYPITVASKTGSPQTSTELLNSTFICFAPADKPEIAIAVVIEKGYHGYTGAPVAKDILDYYFGFNEDTPPYVQEPQEEVAQPQQQTQDQQTQTQRDTTQTADTPVEQTPTEQPTPPQEPETAPPATEQQESSFQFTGPSEE